MTSPYRLRRSLQLRLDPQGRTLLRDPDLKRAMRLGDIDSRLCHALRDRDNTSVSALSDHLGRPVEEIARRLTALARMYLLDGERSRQRLELQEQRQRFEQELRRPAAEVPLHWPLGLDPPRHGCVATGDCCSASFLGPVTAVDRARLEGLGPAVRSIAFEQIEFRGVDYLGMARSEGRCQQQNEEDLCDIHAVHGMDAKPVACRRFPLRFHRSPAGVHVSLLMACGGYHEARPAASPWPSREREVRGLLGEGAVAVNVVVPFEWSAGVPVESSLWWQMREQWFELESDYGADHRGWLAAVLALFESGLQQRETELSEGPEVTWLAASHGLAETLSDLEKGASMYELDSIGAYGAELDERIEALAASGEVADSERLARFRLGLDAQLQGLAVGPRGRREISEEASRHLIDIVANDLALQVAIGHLDAGLSNLVRRVLLCDALSCALSIEEGVEVVQARHTTAALKVVYRCEPELTALASCQRRQDSPSSGV